MESINYAVVHHVPWNKGKLVGQKAPLKQREIWAIRIRLQLQRDARELALFNLAIDSKLRSCDLLLLVLLALSIPTEWLARRYWFAPRRTLTKVASGALYASALSWWVAPGHWLIVLVVNPFVLRVLLGLTIVGGIAISPGK